MSRHRILAAGVTCALLSACSSVETLTARCRAQLAAAPTLIAGSAEAKPSDEAQPQAPPEGMVAICTKESLAAEAQARQAAGVILLAPLLLGAVAIAGSAPSSRYAYRPTYRTRGWRR
jgi:hypothetical protein